MTARLLAIFGLLVLPTASSAQEPATTQPKTMFAYFSTGMHVGVKSVDGTASVLIFVYTDDNHFPWNRRCEVAPLNTISPNFVANIGADLKRVDDPQSGRVLLRFDYRSTSTGELGAAVIGLVERGEADTLQLTILPKATEFVREQTCTRP